MFIIARKHITPRRMLYRDRIVLESYSNRARIAIVIGPLRILNIITLLSRNYRTQVENFVRNVRRGVLARDAGLARYCSNGPVSVWVCLSEAGVLSKLLDESSWSAGLLLLLR